VKSSLYTPAKDWSYYGNTNCSCCSIFMKLNYTFSVLNILAKLDYTVYTSQIVWATSELWPLKMANLSFLFSYSNSCLVMLMGIIFWPSSKPNRFMHFRVIALFIRKWQIHRQRMLVAYYVPTRGSLVLKLYTTTITKLSFDFDWLFFYVWCICLWFYVFDFGIKPNLSKYVLLPFKLNQATRWSHMLSPLFIDIMSTLV